MEGVTMTMTESPLVRHEAGAPWTIEDLVDLPECNRYEIVDGSLVVSPPPNTVHVGAAHKLGRLLDDAAPEPLLATIGGLAVQIKNGLTYLAPDITVVPWSVLKTPALAVDPSAVLLVVEVLSPSNSTHDLITKRHEYAVAGIPQYWIVNQEKRELTVLALDESTHQYVERAVVRAGEKWATEAPYPVVLDPADFC
jgi:Uma2 family endonuclease